MPVDDTILVTGANGFIGGWLAETLYLNGSAQVRAGIRSWSNAVRLSRFPIDVVLCDVQDSNQIGEAMAGASHVVHCAYGPPEVTIEGTRNVLDCALRQGVKRFVHLSTTEVYGNVHGEIAETRPFQYTGGSYTDSKIEAEKLCWAYAQQGLPVTVLRPSIVYGPFGRMWTVDLAGKLQSGNWAALEGLGEGLCNLVYVADLVKAIQLAMRHEAAAGEAFNISGPEILTWNEYFRRYSVAMGLVPLPVQAMQKTEVRTALMEPVRSAARFGVKHFEPAIRSLARHSRPMKTLMQNVETAIKSTPRSADLQLYSRNALYVTAKARRVLGFRPTIGVDAGLALTVRWLEQTGLLDRRAETGVVMGG